MELLVGLLESERRMRESWTAAEFRERGETYVAARRSAGKAVEAMAVLNDDDLLRVRSFRDELLARWAATRSGETLELTFRVSAAG